MCPSKSFCIMKCIQYNPLCMFHCPIENVVSPHWVRALEWYIHKKMNLNLVFKSRCEAIILEMPHSLVLKTLIQMLVEYSLFIQQTNLLLLILSIFFKIHTNFILLLVFKKLSYPPRCIVTEQQVIPIVWT
jgi:hypothetical protein